MRWHVVTPYGHTIFTAPWKWLARVLASFYNEVVFYHDTTCKIVDSRAPKIPTAKLLQ